jgi:hypothetical protein
MQVICTQALYNSNKTNTLIFAIALAIITILLTIPYINTFLTLLKLISKSFAIVVKHCKQVFYLLRIGI